MTQPAAFSSEDEEIEESGPLLAVSQEADPGKDASGIKNPSQPGCSSSNRRKKWDRDQSVSHSKLNQKSVTAN